MMCTTSTKPMSTRQTRGVQRGASLRRGMTLVEVILSLVIISAAMISISAYMAKFAQGIIASDVKATAEDIAATQIESAKTAPRYTAIDTLYPGTVAMPAPYTGYTRQTIVTHTGGGPADLYDYKTVTVIVTQSRLQTLVGRKPTSSRPSDAYSPSGVHPVGDDAGDHAHVARVRYRHPIFPVAAEQ